MQARIFSFENDTFSTYLRATTGLSNLSRDAFGDASGTSTFADKAEYTFSGELGFALTTGRVTTRLGVEFLHPKKVLTDGLNASGTKLFDLDSDVLASVPSLNFELVLFQEGDSRLYAGLGAGYGSVTLENQYEFTADGITATSLSNYKEVSTGTTIGGQACMGIEGLFTDNVTFTAEVGYRIYRFESLKYDNDYTTFQGAVQKGAAVTNGDGSARQLNLSGLYAGVGFRFYIGY